VAYKFPPLNCPTCGLPMRYLWSQGPTRYVWSPEDWHYYHCFRHGLMVLHANGRLEEENRDAPTVRQ